MASHGHVTQQDKADMAYLNDRLAGYMQRMRQLSRNAGDPGYKEALALLEAEMAKVRDTYERELDRLRGNLEAANRDRNALQQFKNRLAEAEGRLNDESNRGRKAIDDVQSLHRALADKEKDIAGLRALLQERDALLNHLRPAYDKFEKQVADLTRQLDDESRRRQAADAALKKLQDKLAFDLQAGDDQKRELENRLRAAHDIINNLEMKLKGRGDDAIQQALQKLRDQQAADLKRFQQEADEKLQRALAGVKGQLDEDGRKREALQRENAKLNDIVQQLQAALRDLENQHNGCQRSRAALEDALNQEKTKAHNTIKDLERKLREHQEAILAKIQECNQSRDLAVALKQEIDSYRALLDGEERRLGAMTASGNRGSSPTLNGYGNGSNGYGNGIGTSGNVSLPKIGTNGMSGADMISARNTNNKNKLDVTTYRRDYCT